MLLPLTSSFNVKFNVKFNVMLSVKLHFPQILLTLLIQRNEKYLSDLLEFTCWNSRIEILRTSTCRYLYTTYLSNNSALEFADIFIL